MTTEAQGEAAWGHQKLEKAGGTPPRDFRGNVAWLTTGLWTSGFPNWKIIHFFCLKPLSLRPFVTKLGNQYRALESPLFQSLPPAGNKKRLQGRSRPHYLSPVSLLSQLQQHQRAGGLPSLLWVDSQLGPGAGDMESAPVLCTSRACRSLADTLFSPGCWGDAGLLRVKCVCRAT